jgi:DNA (cytosine-5)-methyltransferase 1
LSAPSAITAGRNKYLDVLEDAWQEHLAPRAEDAPTVASLFAGCGGSSLGYSMAGYRELLAVEWDDNAAATFRLNFPDVPLYHGDIAALSAERALELAGVQPGQLDVLDGSPPCQGFSTAGKRVLEDPRNGLFQEYVRLLQGFRPRAFVMENVSGMVKGKMKLVFVEILRALKASGYRVSARLMNAMYFNVPQSRQRMIFVGVREDLGVQPGHPVPLQHPLSIRTAFSNLDQAPSDIAPSLLRPTWQMHRVIAGSEPKQHFGLVRTSWNEPSPTIVKDAGNTTTGMIHPEEARRLTIPELKRLASFPDEFRMAGAFKECWARIGNSVPPLFMRAIAAHVAGLLGLEPRRG